MKILDGIRNRLARLLYNNLTGFYGGLQITNHLFARLVFYNICEILTDLSNDVTFVRKSGDVMNFAFFNNFFNENGKYILTKLFSLGWMVIAQDTAGIYRILNPDEFTTITEGGDTVVDVYDKSLSFYVLKSPSYRLYGLSDEQLCKPAMKMLDSVLNSSTTISDRLGAFIIGTPSTPTSSPIAGVLDMKKKKEIEKELSEHYGSKSDQSQMLILPNDMKFQTINLAGLDTKMQEKMKAAVLMICDRIKVPANQVALVDANSSKTLANGSELREGDFNKYQSFERLLNDTFVQMAKYFGLQVDYIIYNKPVRQQTNII